MTDQLFWIVWLLAASTSFGIWEFRAITRKAQGDPKARTLTDVIRSAMQAHITIKLAVTFFIGWMFLHFLSIGGF